MPLIVPILNEPIAQLGPRFPVVIDQAALAEMLTLRSRCFTMGPVFDGNGGGQTSGSGAWFAANCPVAYPFVLDHPITVYQLGWFNGTSAGGGVDIGIYDTAWNRLVSAGATTAVTNSTYQFVDVADTLLTPGTYYLASVRDNITAARMQAWTGATIGTLIQGFAGVQDSATAAYPLPNPLTNMARAATVSSVPYLFIAARALV